MERSWWKEAVVYQIYPRSFYDTNGDGIGDLKGVTQKLDYLKELGVNALWLCPVYQSPNDDNGYDISNYYEIMDEFGTMEDFDELLAQAHARGIKLVMDLVVNHTSDEHAWFQESRSSRDNPKRDFYIWRKGKNGKEPNDWTSNFTPSAWEYDRQTDEYYLHLFSQKQPDLNWENESVRKEVYQLMKWWLDKGIDGFRMDVINCISKDQRFPSIGTGDGYHWGGEYFVNGPRVHEFLQEMNREVLSKYDMMTVGETANISPEEALLYVGKDRNELNMVFQFELMDMDFGPKGKWDFRPWTLTEFKSIITKWEKSLQGKGWNSLYLTNHDQPRQVSRFGDDGVYRVPSAKMLATLLHTLQGTVYVYQGEEIGMTNRKFQSISDFRDIESINMYKEAKKKPDFDEQKTMQLLRMKSRDNARTPMQWNAQKNAGFTTAEQPWIGVNENYPEINVENDLKNPDSIFHYYQKLIALRKQYPIIVYGDYQCLDEQNEKVFCYLRTLEKQRMLVILNFTKETVPFAVPAQVDLTGAKRLIGNYPPAEGERLATLTLRPYEAVVYLFEHA